MEGTKRVLIYDREVQTHGRQAGNFLRSRGSEKKTKQRNPWERRRFYEIGTSRERSERVGAGQEYI